MTIESRPDGYWITSIPDTEDAGPYSTKAEAESDLRGLTRFFKYRDRPGFVTSEREKPCEA